MIILDDFLETTYPELKAHSKTCEFVDETNPIDGVVYPLICKDIPEPVINELYWFLGAVIHRRIKNPLTFMRMTKKGTPCPHTFHNDSSMGYYSCMFYLEDNENAGTALVRHNKTKSVRVTDDILEAVTEDQNNRDAWTIYETAEMKENRAIVFNSDLLHCALPFGGYGETQEDSRIVLTTFFS